MPSMKELPMQFGRGEEFPMSRTMNPEKSNFEEYDRLKRT